MRIDSSTRTRHRAGTTLVELLVVILLLGVLAAIGGLAALRWQKTTTIERRSQHVTAKVAAARREAIRRGLQVSVIVEDSGSVGSATALPDGSVLVDSQLRAMARLDQLTGVASPTGRSRKKEATRATP